jgi:D-sedoheptulose 7-phosphate isomerase
VTAAHRHLLALRRALTGLEWELERLERLGDDLARLLLDGGRLLAVGNGGSAAHAQHLTAELVGRYRSERSPLSAISLHADTSALTAIANDYGFEEAFARQVRAHGRPGDVLVAFSTSGASPNVLAAVTAARASGLTTWGITGPAPNGLITLCDDGIVVDAETSTVQEIHQVAIHILCDAVDRGVSAVLAAVLTAPTADGASHVA